MGAVWHEVTDGTYEADAPAYRDPAESSYGTGWGLLGGRITALANDGDWIYAGTPDGGVWVSRGVAGWRPTFQHGPTTAVGALWVNPADHSLWVGTGEANGDFDGYLGDGVWRTGNHGATYRKVGGDELADTEVYQLRAGDGYLFAATTAGLWRRPLTAPIGEPWKLVFKPDPNKTGSPYRTSMVTDVAINPRTGSVLAVIGWRLGTPYNGFYLSAGDGAPGTFRRVRPRGLDNDDIGRTTLAYAPDGAALYAVIQSPDYLRNGPPEPFQSTSLKGVYTSENGDPRGPWTMIADAGTLARSGSAMKFPSGYEPGVQAWFNQALLVDPADPDRVFLGLEETYESTDRGKTWHTIAPYWNLIPSCYVPPGPDRCPATVHPDMHAFAVSDAGTLYAGSDGGVWSRMAGAAPAVVWKDRSAGLHALQYYNAAVGRSPDGGYEVWGGLQDNGVSVLTPHSRQMAETALGSSGDGGAVLVDPNDADRVATEFIMDLFITSDGGRSTGRTAAWRQASPACYVNPALVPCDPNPAILTQLSADTANGNDWIMGGQYVWESTKGFATVCTATACDWKKVYNTGAGNSVTAVTESRGIAYAGWCAPAPDCDPSGPGSTGFSRGLATNYGGHWHVLPASDLPDRYISALIADPSRPGRVYAVFGGYSRQWIPSAGVGHVFVSSDGGAHWRNISGNLPDAPQNDMVLWHGDLILAGTVGVFIASVPTGQRVPHWTRLGIGLPDAVADSISIYPDSPAILVATHGRGLWRLNL